MTDSITPIFLLSLPRSGSTLLQRILASHSMISTQSEPWLLLPPFYALRKTGIVSEYGHRDLSLAFEDFCRSLPDGKEGYYRAIKGMAVELYSQAADAGSRYFLDKTPRYHLIVEELLETFTEAKFILLWRNPLAVVASIMETWHRGKWLPDLFNTDLYGGLERLADVASSGSGRIHQVRFEELITSPEPVVSGICGYLDLSLQPDMLEDLSAKQLEGHMGDPAGTELYSEVSSEPLTKWKEILAGPVRKSWSRRYLSWIGKDRLELMGYDLAQLLRELDEIPVKAGSLFPDLLRTLRGKFLNAERKIV